VPILRSNDAVLQYEVAGSGLDLVLLHPFPLNHHFWDPVVPALSGQYRVITPDLRTHGDSEAGDGPVTMQRLAEDLHRLCREEGVTKAIFVGASVGGYALFEFWRRYREQVAAIVLSNTRAGPENAEGRANRLRIADQVLRDGTAGFIEDMLHKLLSPATLSNRPDIVDAARHMMQKMSPQDIAGVQRGMADRLDSVETLGTINVPAIVIVGGDEVRAEAELMHHHIRASKLYVIEKAGHYAAMERPEEYARILRQFADEVYH
jgi:pimeloyl-ACP methyl ester carboxylesterase